MEAYKELFRHKRNEEKRHEMITCFQQIWTQSNIFGRMSNLGIKWHVTPHQEFLTRDLGAWTTPPLRVIRTSPSPDIDAEFTTRPDFQTLVQAFVQNIANNIPPQPLRQTYNPSPAIRSQEEDPDTTSNETFPDHIPPPTPPLPNNSPSPNLAQDPPCPPKTLKTQVPPTTNAEEAHNSA